MSREPVISDQSQSSEPRAAGIMSMRTLLLTDDHGYSLGFHQRTPHEVLKNMTPRMTPALKERDRAFSNHRSKNESKS
jgi:hypothetical protein